MTTDETIQSVCQSALDHFGERSQLIAATEELCELGVELMKAANGKQDPHTKPGHRVKLIDEMADVALMMQQVMLNFHITDDEIEEVILKKASGLMNRIERLKYIQTHGVEA